MSTVTPDNPNELRDELLGQLRYLVDEIELLKDVVQRIPANLQEGRPLEDDLSIKEIYGLLAMMDEHIHLPFVRALGQEEAPEIKISRDDVVGKKAWNEQPIEEILNEVQQVRTTLIEAMEDEPDWQKTGRVHEQEMDLFKLAHFITQHDVDRLREMGYRLHESHSAG